MLAIINDLTERDIERAVKKGKIIKPKKMPAWEEISWRYDAYNKVGLTIMLLKFWKNLDSFYPDRKFLE